MIEDHGTLDTIGGTHEITVTSAGVAYGEPPWGDAILIDLRGYHGDQSGPDGMDPTVAENLLLRWHFEDAVRHGVARCLAVLAVNNRKNIRSDVLVLDYAGRIESVAVAQAIGTRLRAQSRGVVIIHRDIHETRRAGPQAPSLSKMQDEQDGADRSALPGPGGEG